MFPKGLGVRGDKIAYLLSQQKLIGTEAALL